MTNKLNHNKRMKQQHSNSLMRYLPISAVDSVHDRHIKWCMVDIGFYLCTIEMNNGTSLTQEH